RLRVLVFFIPLMTLVTLALGGRKPHGGFIDPRSLGELGPVIVPLMLTAAAAAFATGMLLSPQSARPLRYFSIAVTYVLALAGFWAAVVYWLAGGRPAWLVAGLSLAIGSVKLASLSRLAHDVS